MTDPSQPPGLTRDQVYLVGRALKKSMASEDKYNFGPALEICAVPKTKKMEEYIYHATDPNFVLDRLNNPFSKNTVDYFTFKESKFVLTPGNQVWLYASWKDSDNQIKHGWIREAAEFQEDEKSLRNHSLPKSIIFALGTGYGDDTEEEDADEDDNETDQREKHDMQGEFHNFCRDPDDPYFLKSLSFGYTHLPPEYAVGDLVVWIDRKTGIDWMKFTNPSHPFGFYQIEINDEGRAEFLRSEALDSPLAGRRYLLSEDEIPEDELSPKMRKVNDYLRNIPALCEYLSIPDFSRFVRQKPKIVDDLNAYMPLDAMIFDEELSSAQTTFFKEKFTLR